MNLINKSVLCNRASGAVLVSGKFCLAFVEESGFPKDIFEDGKVVGCLQCPGEPFAIYIELPYTILKTVKATALNT